MTDSETGDRELVARISSGEPDALRDLYQIHGARLYAHALRIAGDPAAAEDILQESLVAVWKAAGRFRGESRVIVWLLGIVHHKALDSIGGRSRYSLEENDGSGLVSPDPRPEEALLRKERRDLIKSGLGRLSTKHRLVLDLVFFQGLSLAEAAGVCGCPVGTIKSRLNQAKANLRAHLDIEKAGEDSK
ncbi:MAG: RNA polymerase sigma factor [Candidatus Aminicenantes bacterium]|nr:RNA polymerase sigma factor [Candidatus Aminicenantes bacterium]